MGISVTKVTRHLVNHLGYTVRFDLSIFRDLNCQDLLVCQPILCFPMNKSPKVAKKVPVLFQIVSAENTNQ